MAQVHTFTLKQRRALRHWQRTQQRSFRQLCSKLEVGRAAALRYVQEGQPTRPTKEAKRLRVHNAVKKLMKKKASRCKGSKTRVVISAQEVSNALRGTPLSLSTIYSLMPPADLRRREKEALIPNTALSQEQMISLEKTCRNW